jgi:hypothetical protein
MLPKAQLQTISALTSALLFATLCFGQSTTRISVDANGAQANSTSWLASLSEGGEFVAFQSGASNLVPGDTNGMSDIFVKNTITGAIERIDVDVNGVQSNHNGWSPQITPDGRFVVYESGATNIVPGDTNWVIDIYVHDRQTGITEIVSVGSMGAGGNNHSFHPSISDNGTRVAFMSKATNLVGGDTNGEDDIFVRDRRSGITTRVSVDSTGFEANDYSDHASISGDGNFVTYHSKASNLVLNDFNNALDCFVYEWASGGTTRVSVDALGVEGNHHSQEPVISANGRFVAFQSSAYNFVPNDSVTNDIFVHDRWTGGIEKVSRHSNGYPSSDDCYDAAISNDGRHVAFWTLSSYLIPNDSNHKRDVFVHDRDTDVTERVSVRSNGVQVPDGYCVDPDISPDGSCAAFRSDGYIVADDTNFFDDLFLHQRWSGEGINSIYLTAPSSAAIGSTIDLSWQCTRGGSQYWVAYSLNQGGQIFGGHSFDLGLPSYVLISGVHTTNGMGNYTTAPVPTAAAGFTLHFEIAAQDAAGVLYDSNPRSVLIN